MGKKWKIAAILLCVLFLCGCMDTTKRYRKHSANWPDTFEQMEIPEDDPVENPAPDATQTETPEDDLIPPPPAHSVLYNPQYTTEQIWEYFQEVALAMEYTDGSGDPSLVQKWLSPIKYYVYGSPTEEDNAYLYNLLDQLNEIPGFPGFVLVQEEGFEDLAFYFEDYNEFNDRFSDAIHGESAFGAVQFWYYTETNEIYSANIGYRTDIDQESRNSVILEEIINCLGISDSELREDSIVYQYSNSNTALSDVDWIIIKILYDPAISCGMNAEECRAVVESLYY